MRGCRCVLARKGDFGQYFGLCSVSGGGLVVVVMMIAEEGGRERGVLCETQLFSEAVSGPNAERLDNFSVVFAKFGGYLGQPALWHEGVGFVKVG